MAQPILDMKTERVRAGGTALTTKVRTSRGTRIGAGLGAQPMSLSGRGTAWTPLRPEFSRTAAPTPFIISGIGEGAGGATTRTAMGTGTGPRLTSPVRRKPTPGLVTRPTSAGLPAIPEKRGSCVRRRGLRPSSGRERQKPLRTAAAVV